MSFTSITATLKFKEQGKQPAGDAFTPTARGAETASEEMKAILTELTVPR